MNSSSKHETKIDTVIFDLGGVLVDWSPRYLFRKIFKTDSEVEEFLANTCTSIWNEKMDAGIPFVEAVEELVLERPRYAEEIRAYHTRWGEMIRGDIPGTVKILRELHERGRHRIGALSNWSHETFPIARKRFDFFDFFEFILISGEEKVVKPNPEFFKILETRYGVQPQTSVFIDDVEKNVRAAEGLGYKVVHFRDADDLRNRLTSMKVL